MKNHLQKSNKTAGLLVFCSLLAIPAFAQRWDLLGQSNVDGSQDHDKIQVGNGKGPYRALKMQVQNGGIIFDRVIVHYENGADIPVRIATTIRAGGSTRVIDLPGDRRYIKEVEFYYGRLNPNSPKPKVLLFGMRY